MLNIFAPLHLWRMCVWSCAMYLSALVSEELPSIVDDLFICEVGVWLLLTNAQHLPQGDSKCPHITGRGELTLGTHRHTDQLKINTSELLIIYQNPRKSQLIPVKLQKHKTDTL